MLKSDVYGMVMIKVEVIDKREKIEDKKGKNIKKDENNIENTK